jgi:hypothetical protein
MDENTTPVLVGCGQFTQRESDPLAAMGPLDLMAKVASLAADDAGPGSRLIEALDTLVVVRLFSDTSPRFASPFGRFANPPKSLARRIGASNASRLVYTQPGGNMPQWSINQLAQAITRGELSAGMVVGAEALATRKPRSGPASHSTGMKTRAAVQSRGGWQSAAGRISRKFMVRVLRSICTRYSRMRSGRMPDTV